ncbi:unnamed protein product [Adineta ricciae]|uniref:Uncharacterized protein n=1 Tax=Adineta ricciae TaxID=249248 RepID=A0A815IP28_ADIRI|nr:unnamed protein product [Adineta ricciae]CAF1370927.1 unnamed protein product [Adineta ricciae]
MSNISSVPTFMSTMLQTSNLICRSIQLTDELKIGVEYDCSHGLLNIFVKNTGHQSHYPSQINLHSNENKDYLLQSSQIQERDIENEITDLSFRDDDDEPKICIEVSNIYVYDIFDENENNLCETMVASSLSSSTSSCFDEQTSDNDDGYSTHSLDDTEHQQQQHQPCPMPLHSSKLIIPFVSSQHDYYLEECVSPIRRLIEQTMWLSPFKMVIKQMMINHLY